MVETVVSPYHCLYQDALALHTRSKMEQARSETDSGRLARAGFLLYMASAEALVHQAAEELGRPELASVVADPSRPLPLAEAWRLLPAILAEPRDPGAAGGFDPRKPPWPQFAELLALKASWAYPGPPESRRAYYIASVKNGEFDPLSPHAIPEELGIEPDRLVYPRTGIPRDPYAFRPQHLDTAKGVLDAAVEALDRRTGGSLLRDQRHRREPMRVALGAKPDSPDSAGAGPKS